MLRELTPGYGDNTMIMCGVGGVIRPLVRAQLFHRT
jgi:hypothetical protein